MPIILGGATCSVKGCDQPAVFRIGLKPGTYLCSRHLEEAGLRWFNDLMRSYGPTEFKEGHDGKNYDQRVQDNFLLQDEA